MPDKIIMNDKEERYLTIKELSWELEKIGLPSSRPFINKHKSKCECVCNRIKFSDFLNAIKK